ncbi:MAG: SH3 domain-containing protein [Lachnospiraceae bacterium]|nr:SH3 domain-containing protein [Lachnospiraceae bacterium]
MYFRKHFLCILIMICLLSGCIPETVPELSSEAEPFAETAEQNESSEPGSETEPLPEPKRFMGKIMDERIALLNEKTVSNRQSGVRDVTRPDPVSGISVYEMMNRFSFPDVSYRNDRLMTEEEKEELLANRNVMEALKASLSSYSPYMEPRFGIVTENADLKMIPTSERITKAPGERENDLNQESGLTIASGVLIYAESSDGQFYFVLGENDYGYVLKESVALCDQDEFVSYLSPDEILVTVRPDPFDPLDRLGRILPVSEIKSSGTAAVRFPKRDADGRLALSEVEVPFGDGKHVTGFLPFDPSAVRTIAESMVGTEYGWGDRGNLYDCSAFAGAVYRCFGIYLPRNSGDFRFFGGEVIDLKGKSFEEKAELLSGSVGGIVLFPGHVMVITEGESSKTVLIHAVKGWYNTAQEYVDAFKISKTPVEELFSADGSNWIDRFTTILRCRF